MITDKLIPEKLDLVMRDDDFVIYYDGKPMKTPGGALLAHSNARVLKHILIKLHLNASIITKKLNSTHIFTFLLDYILKGHDLIASNFELVFNHDFVIMAHMGGDPGKIHSKDVAIEYLMQHPYLMSLVFWSNSVIIEGFKSFLSGIDEQAGDEAASPLIKRVKRKYDELSDARKAGVNLLSMHHKNGLILPMMLVLGYISPSEYANSTLSVQARQTDDGNLLNVLAMAEEAGVESFNLDAEDPLGFVRVVHEEALKTLEFLGFFKSGQRKISVINELISLGESDQVEFKSTFRWDIRQGKKNPAIEHASLKTMAAFLNSEGGDLLIGVEDDGNILGVELDNFPNDDKFLLHLWSLIKSSMGQDISPFIKTTLEKMDGKTVCRVHCLPGSKPVFLRQKGFDESFYIRIGPSSGRLEISEALKYIADRFKS